MSHPSDSLSPNLVLTPLGETEAQKSSNLLKAPKRAHTGGKGLFGLQFQAMDHYYGNIQIETIPSENRWE